MHFSQLQFLKQDAIAIPSGATSGTEITYFTFKPLMHLTLNQCSSARSEWQILY